MPRRKIDDEKFKELHAAGQTYSYMASYFGVSRNYIANYAQKLNLPKRKTNFNRGAFKTKGIKTIDTKVEVSKSEFDEVMKKATEKADKMKKDAAIYAATNYGNSKKLEEYNKSKRKNNAIEIPYEEGDYISKHKSYNKYGDPTLKNIEDKGYFIIDPFNRLVVREDDGVMFKVMSLKEVIKFLKNPTTCQI